MSIATVVTRGYGSFGSVAEVVTRGYAVGVAPTPPVVTEVTTGGATGTYRYFTPGAGLPKKQKKRIDALVEREAKIKTQIVEHQESGVDVAILEKLALALRELQLTLLMLALESQAASAYIEMKRDEEEEEDIRYILQFL